MVVGGCRNPGRGLGFLAMAKLLELVGLPSFLAVLVLGACHGKQEDTTPKSDAAEAGVPKVDPTLCDTKTGLKAEVERDTDFDGKFDVKEVYDSAGQLTRVHRDRNGDGQPDLWEQYKDGVLIAILYDDDFDGKVDRREEIPGARPKIEMPTTMDPTATSPINSSGNAPPAAGSGAPAPKAPAPAPAPKK